MKLKIWQDEEGRRHTSLAGMDISGIITSLDLCNRPHQPTRVDLQVLASSVEVEVEAEVYVNIGGKKYRIYEDRSGNELA